MAIGTPVFLLQLCTDNSSTFASLIMLHPSRLPSPASIHSSLSLATPILSTTPCCLCIFCTLHVTMKSMANYKWPKKERRGGWQFWFKKEEEKEVKRLKKGVKVARGWVVRLCCTFLFIHFVPTYWSRLYIRLWLWIWKISLIKMLQIWWLWFLPPFEHDEYDKCLPVHVRIHIGHAYTWMSLHVLVICLIFVCKWTCFLVICMDCVVLMLYYAGSFFFLGKSILYKYV